MSGNKKQQVTNLSEQRNQWVANQNQLRGFAAQGYNNNSAAFNANIAAMAAQAGNTRQRASSLTLKDNEQYGSLESELAGLRSSLAGITFADQAPSWSSSVMSPFADDLNNGMVELSMPTLNAPNMGMRSAAAAEIDAGLNALNSIRAQRKAEEDRINSVFGSLNSATSGLSTSIQGAGLKEYEAQRAALRTQLGGLKAQQSGLRSEVLDDGYMSNEFQGLNTSLSGLESTVGDFENRYNTEKTRISDFERNLMNVSEGYNDRLRNATIRDVDLFNTGEADLMGLKSQARNFSSELGYDLGQENGSIESALSRILGLRQQRSAEESRVGNLRSQAVNEALSMQELMDAANSNNLNDLNSIGSRLTGLRRRIGNEKTDLGQSYMDSITGEVSGYLDPLDQRLTAAKTDRQARLDDILSQAVGQTTGLADIELQNEGAFTDRRNKLSQLLSGLSEYQGGDLNDERTRINAEMAKVDSRLQELSLKRADIESQAAALLSEIESGSYYNASELNPFQIRLKEQQAQQKLFNAKQALDEIDRVTQSIAGQRQRIERDVLSRTSARDAERANFSALLSAGTSPLATGSLSLGNLTAEQIAMIVAASNAKKDQQPGVQNASSFSQNLVVA